MPCLAPLRDRETHCGQNEAGKGKTVGGKDSGGLEGARPCSAL